MFYGQEYKGSFTELGHFRENCYRWIVYMDRNMFRFKPVRNLCFVGDDIWFIARGINALFRYSSKSNEVSCIELPGSVDMDFSYIGTHYYDNKIVMPPVYNKGFGEYDIETGQFRQLLTPNSQRPCNFGFSFTDGEEIFCVPNYMDGPFVTFNMKNQKECGSVFYFPKEYSSGNATQRSVQKVSSNLYYGLLYPINTVYMLHPKTGEFTFHTCPVEGQIESLYILNDYIYLGVQDRIVLTDLKMNLIAEKHFDINEQYFFIGDYGEGVFIDVPNSPIKRTVEFDGEQVVVGIFDESNTYMESSINNCGIIQYNEIKKCYLYFSASSNGIYECSGGVRKFIPLNLADDDCARIVKRYLRSLQCGGCRLEGDVFNLANYIEGVSKIQ